MLKILDRLEEWLIASLMAGATIVVFLAVLHRFLLGLPIPALQDALANIDTSWAQELCIFMFVWMAKFGAAYGVRTGIHVGVDVLINRLAAPWHKRFVIFGLLAGALFTATVGTLGVRLVYDLSHSFSSSEVLEIPMWKVYLAVPLGSYLMCFRFLQVTWSFVRTGALPEHDGAHVDGIDDDLGAAA